MLGDVNYLDEWAAYDICDCSCPRHDPRTVPIGRDSASFFIEAALKPAPGHRRPHRGTADAIVEGLPGCSSTRISSANYGAIRLLVGRRPDFVPLGAPGSRMARTRFTGESALRKLRNQTCVELTRESHDFDL